MKRFYLASALIFTLALGASAATNSVTSLSMRNLPAKGQQNFTSHSGEIEESIYRETGRKVSVTINQVSIMRPNCYRVSMRDNQISTYQGEVTVCDVTEQNENMEAISASWALARTVEEAKALEQEAKEANEQTASSDSRDISLAEGDGIRMGGAPFFVDIWMQGDGNTAANSTPEIKKQWVRLRLGLAGIARGKDNFTAVAKINATLWQADMDVSKPGTITFHGMVRLATLKVGGALMHTPDDMGGTYGRLDLELGGLGIASSFKLKKDLALYANESVGLGMRVLERNLASFTLAMTGDIRVGLLIGRKFFVGGKLDAEMGGDSKRVTTGIEAGWHVTRQTTLRAGLDRVEYNKTGPQDPMAIEPEGWNVNFGLFHRW